eukprot:scaffold338543_cov31-Prasinocladus_malaysianus.AAC.1
MMRFGVPSPVLRVRSRGSKAAGPVPSAVETGRRAQLEEAPRRPGGALRGGLQGGVEVHRPGRTAASAAKPCGESQGKESRPFLKNIGVLVKYLAAVIEPDLSAEVTLDGVLKTYRFGSHACSS